MDTTLERKIRTYIVENLAYVEDRFEDDTSLIDAGLIDSVGVLELVTYLQSEFGITVAQEDVTIAHFDSVSNIANFVREKRIQRAQAAD